MNTRTPPQCPFHGDAAASSRPVTPETPEATAPALHPPGVWPPGPPAGITGWGLLRQMSGDLLGTLAQWKRTYGDVVYVRFWPEHAVVVTDPQLVRALLVTHHHSLIRWERGVSVMSQLHGHSVLIAEGDAWHHKRQTLQPYFLPKSVQTFVPHIAAATARALDAWPQRDAHWSIESALTSLTMDVIMRQVFSGEIGDEARMAERALRVASEAADAEFYWPASWPDWMPWKREKRRAVRGLKGLIDRHVNARLAMPADVWPDDLLSRLLRLHREDPQTWSLQAVRDECMTTFLAGHETTAGTLTWWAWCMASNPAIQEAARDEVIRVLGLAGEMVPSAEPRSALRYLSQTIDETLRLYPAAPTLLSRRATRPITLGAWQFPARTLFMLPVQLLQHDARSFAEPTAFRPERFASDAPAAPRGTHMPFGAGPRVCLGQHLATTEIIVIAAMILQRFTLSVPDGMAAPKPRMHVTLRPETALHLGLTAIPSPDV
ncbi:cytochrome P450 [Pandoraea sp. PE-S2R-1]|uniref:cytochrome P450 n=1 Tax=Pandoraea sp. PE-S2R-1 TaxID=1986994 RepID=UPI000B3F75C2|nr:cytochrome P450 [Pandoraea sp. PE-S2R-1]